MKILILLTMEPNLRIEIQGWDMEDSDLFVPNKPIGLTPSPQIPNYKTVLEALADGWKLLAPPKSILDELDQSICYNWWLTKE